MEIINPVYYYRVYPKQSVFLRVHGPSGDPLEDMLILDENNQIFILWSRRHNGIVLPEKGVKNGWVTSNETDWNRMVWEYLNGDTILL